MINEIGGRSTFLFRSLSHPYGFYEYSLVSRIWRKAINDSNLTKYVLEKRSNKEWEKLSDKIKPCNLHKIKEQYNFVGLIGFKGITYFVFNDCVWRLDDGPYTSQHKRASLLKQRFIFFENGMEILNMVYKSMAGLDDVLWQVHNILSEINKTGSSLSSTERFFISLGKLFRIRQK